MSVASLCNKLWAIDSVDFRAINDAAREAGAMVQQQGSQVVATVADTLEQILRTTDGTANIAAWYLFDRIAKESEPIATHLQTSFFGLAVNFMPWTDPALSAKCESLLDSLSYTFGAAVATKVRLSRPTTATTQSTPHQHHSSTPSATGGSDAPTQQLVAYSHNTRDLGLYRQQVGPARGEGKLTIKGRDSLLAVRSMGQMAPAVAEEIAMPIPQAASDAPHGFMQALPADHLEKYRAERREKLKKVFAHLREKREAEASDREGKRKTTPGRRKRGMRVNFDDLNLPEEYPRDEYGIQIGNYPQGVKFLRDAIRQCGGAIELGRLERRVGATTELKENLGNLRYFLEIHKNTFQLNWELGADGDKVWVVRVSGDPQPAEGKTATWIHTTCPDCGVGIDGMRLPRHLTSRRCVGTQLMRGVEGETATPIMRLANLAAYITRVRGNIDDGDISDFATCIEECGELKRFRFASARQFGFIVLAAVRVIRDKWCRERGTASVRQILPFHWYERAYVHFFATLGANIRRLPIPWIELGDMEDMCANVIVDSKEPHVPPPMPADPRIRPRNEYPGFLFCDEGSDDDDKPSDEEEEYSDDEAPQFEFAPPITITQAITSAGVDHDVKKLNHYLRTAPPIPASVVHSNSGAKTHEALAKAAVRPPPALGVAGNPFTTASVDDGSNSEANNKTAPEVTTLLPSSLVAHLQEPQSQTTNSNNSAAQTTTFVSQSSTVTFF
eukprot:PhM_4_TR15757/c0_g1_i1/m.36145